MHDAHGRARRTIRTTSGTEGSNSGPGTQFDRFTGLCLGLASGSSTLPTKVTSVHSVCSGIILSRVGRDSGPNNRLFQGNSIRVRNPRNLTVRGKIGNRNGVNTLLASVVRLTASSRVPQLRSTVVSRFLFRCIRPFCSNGNEANQCLLTLCLGRSLAVPAILSLSHAVTRGGGTCCGTFVRTRSGLGYNRLALFIGAVLKFVQGTRSRLVSRLRIEISRLSGNQTIYSRLRQGRNLSTGTISVLCNIVRRRVFSSAGSVALGSTTCRVELSGRDTEGCIKRLVSTNLTVRSKGHPLGVQTSRSLGNVLRTKVNRSTKRRNNGARRRRARATRRNSPTWLGCPRVPSD